MIEVQQLYVHNDNNDNNRGKQENSVATTITIINYGTSCIILHSR